MFTVNYWYLTVKAHLEVLLLEIHRKLLMSHLKPLTSQSKYPNPGKPVSRYHYFEKQLLEYTEKHEMCTYYREYLEVSVFERMWINYSMTLQNCTDEIKILLEVYSKLSISHSQSSRWSTFTRDTQKTIDIPPQTTDISKVNLLIQENQTPR